MKNLKIEIQIPSGKFIDVTPTNAMPIIRGLLDGTDYIPELVTSLSIKTEISSGKIVEIILSPIDGFQPVIDILDK